MKKILFILLITIWVLILWLVLAFYISKKTNKPCNHVDIDCKEFCDTHSKEECLTCRKYTYCWPEALLDRINFLHI
jgi:hypothetical protein